MNKRYIAKVYLIVFLILFVAGTIWSVINGYRYFCDGLQACDNTGQVLSWDVFWKRELLTLLWLVAMSAFITFMFVKDKGKGGNGSD